MSLVTQARAFLNNLLYDAANRGREQRSRPQVATDHKKSVSHYTWKEMLSAGRNLYANFGPVRGAVLEKATLAVCDGWESQFIGSDREWGTRAEEWLWNWHKICDIRGEPFDFYNDLLLASIALDRDGDFGVLLVDNGDGYPGIQFVPAHRIGARDNYGTNSVTGYQGTVKEGRFKGFPLYNGVIFNRFGRAVGYRVLGDAADGTQDRDISSRDMMMLFDPDWFDMGRGITSFSSVILDCMDIQDIRKYEKIAVKTGSTKSVIETNEQGRIDMGPRFIRGDQTPGDKVDVQLEELEGGTMHVLKAGSGSKLEMFDNNRPSPAWQGFVEHILRGCYQSIEWPIEYTYDTSSIGSAGIRLVIGKVMRTVKKRQKLLRKVATRIDGYAVAKAIRTGLLPPNDEWWMWDYVMPKSLSIDAGHDAKAEIEQFKIGHKNLRDIYAQVGKWWEEERDQQGIEITDLLVRAKQTAAENDISLQEALTLWQQRTPNANGPPDTGAAPAPQPDEE